jgi:hypothetical protein
MNSMPQELQLPIPRHAGQYQARPPRNPACLFGKLVYGDGVFTLDCTVRDISEGGAKIIISEQQGLPPDIILIVVKHRVAYQAKVMWLKFPARGIKFLKSYALDATLPTELKFLRQLWVDLCPRAGGNDTMPEWEVAELVARCGSTY